MQNQPPKAKVDIIRLSKTQNGAQPSICVYVQLHPGLDKQNFSS